MAISCGAAEVVRPDACAPECGLDPPNAMAHQGVDVGKDRLKLQSALLDLSTDAPPKSAALIAVF